MVEDDGFVYLANYKAKEVKRFRSTASSHAYVTLLQFGYQHVSKDEYLIRKQEWGN